MSKKFFVFIFALIFLPSVFALGVTPAKNTISFEPGIEKSVKFTILNSEKMNAKMSLSVKGDLAEYVVLPYDSFSITSEEDSREIVVKITAPSFLSPGTHKAEIVILQSTEEQSGGETTINAVLAVVAQIQINVAYPGKYAEAELKIESSKKDGKYVFIIPVVSKGSFDLTNVRAVVDIYSSLNEKVDSFETKSISIPSGKKAELVYEWKPKVNPGPYRAVATLLYDEKSLTLEKKFNVGEEKLALEKIEVKDFTLGQVAKFEMLVENKWSEKISGVYSQMKIFSKEGNVLADFKSPTYDIEPLKKILMVSYWDSAGVKEGTYESIVYLKYGEETEEKSLKLDVKKNSVKVIGLGYVIAPESEKAGESKESNGLITILIIVIVVLILINVSWFVFLRRKLKK